jgi:fructose-1,6-bisphosphatase/inositol monophosphatase family enzyme
LNKLQNLAEKIRTLHETIRNEVVTACENASIEALSEISYEAGEDTIYAIDKISEARLLEFFAKEIAPDAPIILIAEGIEGGQVVLPAGTAEQDAEYRIIMDPIDGTRSLMCQKRSAWILTGVAPNKGANTNFADIEFAIQTEIPLVKQHLSDMVWAFKGQGAQGQRYNRITGENKPLKVQPSQADTIAHGYAMICRFFPGAREVLAEIDEEIIYNILGEVRRGKAHCFEDQYACTGGQLYELINGRDRFIGDLRPLMEKILAERGLSLGICVHPYDICTELIARELGVIITDHTGQILKTKLNVTGEVTWVGYANEKIRRQVEPHLHAALKKRNLV